MAAHLLSGGGGLENLSGQLAALNQQAKNSGPRPAPSKVGVARPHDHDVLCGRGGASNNHHGNAIYRSVVARNKPLYRSVPKHHKVVVARAIVDAVAQQDPAGRFLQKNNRDGLWYEIAYNKAVEKTAQALREKDLGQDETNGGDDASGSASPPPSTTEDNKPSKAAATNKNGGHNSSISALVTGSKRKKAAASLSSTSKTKSAAETTQNNKKARKQPAPASASTQALVPPQRSSAATPPTNAAGALHMANGHAAAAAAPLQQQQQQEQQTKRDFQSFDAAADLGGPSKKRRQDSLLGGMSSGRSVASVEMRVEGDELKPTLVENRTVSSFFEWLGNIPTTLQRLNSSVIAASNGDHNGVGVEGPPEQDPFDDMDFADTGVPTANGGSSAPPISTLSFTNSQEQDAQTLSAAQFLRNSLESTGASGNNPTGSSTTDGAFLSLPEGPNNDADVPPPPTTLRSELSRFLMSLAGVDTSGGSGPASAKPPPLQPQAPPPPHDDDDEAVPPPPMGRLGRAVSGLAPQLRSDISNFFAGMGHNLSFMGAKSAAPPPPPPPPPDEEIPDMPDMNRNTSMFSQVSMASFGRNASKLLNDWIPSFIGGGGGQDTEAPRACLTKRDSLLDDGSFSGGGKSQWKEDSNHFSSLLADNDDNDDAEARLLVPKAGRLTELLAAGKRQEDAPPREKPSLLHDDDDDDLDLAEMTDKLRRGVSNTSTILSEAMHSVDAAAAEATAHQLLQDVQQQQDETVEPQEEEKKEKKSAEAVPAPRGTSEPPIEQKDEDEDDCAPPPPPALGGGSEPSKGKPSLFEDYEETEEERRLRGEV